MNEEQSREQFQLQQALVANQQLAADVASLTSSLGRMTSERDSIQSQLDESRGKVVALQTRLASQSRAIDQAKQEARDLIAGKTREHADAMKRLHEQHAAMRERDGEQIKKLAEDLRATTAALKAATEQRDEARKLLEKYEPQIRCDRARAELAELERQEAELARKKDAAKKAVDSFTPSVPPPDLAPVDRASRNVEAAAASPDA